MAVWTHEDVEDLLPRPETDGLPDCRRGDVDVQLSVSEVGADLCELAAVEEAVSFGEEVGGSDEVLDGSDHGLSVTRCDEVVLDAHKLEGFGSGFFCLWYV